MTAEARQQATRLEIDLVKAEALKLSLENHRLKTIFSKVEQILTTAGQTPRQSIQASLDWIHEAMRRNPELEDRRR